MAKRPTSDSQFEISFYENILKKSPNFIEALICLGDLYTKEGFYQKGLLVDEKLARLRPDDPTVFYNLACSYSLMNDVVAADRAMRRAIDRGYEDLDSLQRDPDLLNLLSDDSFRDYVKGLRAKKPQKKHKQGAA